MTVRTTPPARGAASPAARLAGACAGIALLAGCAPQAAPPAPAPTVLTTFARVESNAGASAYAGEIRPRYESVLSFRIDGKLVSRSAHLGDHVLPGQPLAQLDPSDTVASEAAARAALAAAQSRLELARQQRDRNAAQLREDLVSQADADQSEAGLSVALADVEQRREELDLAAHQAQYATLGADHEGFITSENAEVGAVVRAGQPVLGLAWSAERDAVIDVPEGRIGEVTRGQRASVELAAAPGTQLAASVREIAEAADPQARTYRVKLALLQPSSARLGMTATVRLVPHAAHAALSIPASALFHQDAQPAVWVVDAREHRLALRRVAVAAYHADDVALTGGLAADDMIVAQGVHAVSAGQIVQPVPLGSAGGAGGSTP